MRIPEENEDITGKVCVCSIGRAAIVTGRFTFQWGESWAGLGLDGKGSWCSRAPCVIAESGHEYFLKLHSLAQHTGVADCEPPPELEEMPFVGCNP